MSAKPLDQIRAICMSFPEATERLSHGEPTWFVQGKRVFTMFADNHHDDRVAAWIPAPPGYQDVMIKSSPEKYFCPPYVGGKGWLGVYLDVDVDWEEVSSIVRLAYLLVAPKKLVALLEE